MLSDTGRSKPAVLSSAENPHITGQTSNKIWRELASHMQLCADRRSILDQALSLVTGYANASQRTDPDLGSHQPRQEEDGLGPADLAPELVYMMIDGKSSNRATVSPFSI